MSASKYIPGEFSYNSAAQTATRVSDKVFLTSSAGLYKFRKIKSTVTSIMHTHLVNFMSAHVPEKNLATFFIH